jgi:hypothetical protein
MSVWKKDFLWWNPSHTRLGTNIINLEFWHSTCKDRVTNFETPTDIFFERKRDYVFDLNIFHDEIIIPDGYSTMSSDDLNYEIRVHRIGLPKGRKLHVDFHNLSQTRFLDVVVTSFKFPEVEDFVNSTKVTSEKSSLIMINQHDFDIYSYVGILVNRETATSSNIQSLSYQYSFTVSHCIRWLMLKSKWELACKPGSEGNTSVIHCQCTNFSTLAGYEENIRSLKQEVWRPEIELELQSTKIIFVTVVVTFAIFLVLLTLGIMQKKHQIYYLADNNGDHLFAYLIIVRTGIGYKSGTSSNVTITVTGDKDSSAVGTNTFDQLFSNDTFAAARVELPRP